MVHVQVQHKLFLLGVGLHGIIACINIMWDIALFDLQPLSHLHDSSFHGIGFYVDGAALFQSLSSFISQTPTFMLLLASFVFLIVGMFGNKSSAVSCRILCGLTYAILLQFSGIPNIMLWFPWDCLLFELLLLSAVCPDTLWTFELLLFRVMFGFGKHKFLGAFEWEDLTYTSSMACWQPLGTSLGWYMAFAPNWVHVLLIGGTFVVEIVCPLAFVFDLGPRLKKISCLSTIGLMLGIQLTGHFGWFNSLTALLAWRVYCEAGVESPHRKRGLLVKSISAVYVCLSLIFLIPSQWNSPSLFYQHSFDRPEFELLRQASSWRVLHSYGVFPPKKMPMIKPVGRFEVTTESGHTEALEYQYQLSGSYAEIGLGPFQVAPWRFPRFDYIVGFYAASHVFSLTTRLGLTLGSGEEYVESVGRMLLDDFPKHSRYFKQLHLAGSRVASVQFFVIGLVPDWELGWRQVSRELDREWTKGMLGKPVVFNLEDNLGPNLIVLRRQSALFQQVHALLQNPSLEAAVSEIQNQFSPVSLPHRIFDAAVSLVDTEVQGFVSERVWLANVEETYLRLGEMLHPGTSLPSLFSDCSSAMPGLWNLCHSTQFGGYIGCLTFAHLVPHPLHSPLCPKVLLTNRAARKNSTDAYSKIPIDNTVYWLLGLS